MQAKIVGISIAVNAGEAAYIPLAHDYPGAPEQLSIDTILNLLKPMLEDEKIKKIGQNIKYDAHVFLNLCEIVLMTSLLKLYYIY